MAEYEPGIGEPARRVLRGAKAGDRRREQRRLRVGGTVEVLGRPLEAERAQVDPERVVRFLEDPRRAHVAVGEVLSHPDGLRALPRKKPYDAHEGGKSR